MLSGGRTGGVGDAGDGAGGLLIGGVGLLTGLGCGSTTAPGNGAFSKGCRGLVVGLMTAGVGVDAGLIGVLVVGIGLGLGVAIGTAAGGTISLGAGLVTAPGEGLGVLGVGLGTTAGLGAGVTGALGAGETIVPPEELGKGLGAGLGVFAGLGAGGFELGLTGGLEAGLAIAPGEGLAELPGFELGATGLEAGVTGGLEVGGIFVPGRGLTGLATELEPPAALFGEGEVVELLIDVEEPEFVDGEADVELLEAGEPDVPGVVSGKLDELEVPEPLGVLGAEVDPEGGLEFVDGVVPPEAFGTGEVSGACIARSWIDRSMTCLPPVCVPVVVGLPVEVPPVVCPAGAPCDVLPEFN